MPYRRYIAENILRPLGMTSTTLEPREVPAARLAQGYRWEDEQWKLEPQLPDGAFGAMGGMLTSARDLGVYVGDVPEPRGRRAMVRRPVPCGARRSGRCSRSIALGPPVVARGQNGALQLSAGGYGFGLGISSNCDFAHIVAHSGGLPGFGSLMRWLPEYGVGIIAFGNRTYTGWGGPIDRRVRV